MQNQYLQWLSQTQSHWWNDSAGIGDLKNAMESGACGVTTNPYLVSALLHADPDARRSALEGMPALSGDARAEELVRRVTVKITDALMPVYKTSGGRFGFACAQVNPKHPGDADEMRKMAQRLHGWAPNIAVKLPVTQAGLDVLEECAALGITVTATVSFTAAQALAVAQRYEMGASRARTAGLQPGRCFAVLMIGRLDDYLRDVAHDSLADLTEDDIRTAGIAVAKRTYDYFQECGYSAVIMPAALRGVYHASALAGADMVFSVHPSIQKQLEAMPVPYERGSEKPVSAAVLKKLCRLREFRRAYEPDGLKPDEFITYGAAQRTLTQFVESGWAQLERFGL